MAVLIFGLKIIGKDLLLNLTVCIVNFFVLKIKRFTFFFTFGKGYINLTTARTIQTESLKDFKAKCIC
jgi:hypothetical protein